MYINQVNAYIMLGMMELKKQKRNAKLKIKNKMLI